MSSAKSVRSELTKKERTENRKDSENGRVDYFMADVNKL